MNNVVIFAELSQVQVRFTQENKPIQEAIATFQSGYGDKIESHTIKVVKWGEEPLMSGLLFGRLRINKGAGYELTVNQNHVMTKEGDRPVNQVYATGRVGRDPEVKYFESGSVVAKFSIAVDRNSKNESDPDWFNLEVWGKTAQTVADYVRKGSLIEIIGELKIESWNSKEGEGKSKPVIRVERFNFLGSRKDNEAYQQQESTPTASKPISSREADYVPF